MDIDRLKRLQGQRVELSFRDGHVVRCRLVDVDRGSPERELIYDELEVVAWGPVSPDAVDLGSAAAAALAELVDITELPDK